MGHADEFGPGDIGAVAKLKETHANDLLCASDRDDVKLSLPPLPAPPPSREKPPDSNEVGLWQPIALSWLRESGHIYAARRTHAGSGGITPL
jgi:hypothetical protein